MNPVYVLYHSLSEPSDINIALTWEGVMRVAQQMAAELEEDEHICTINRGPVEVNTVNTVVVCDGEAMLMVYCVEPEELQFQRLVHALKEAHV